jgi:ferredoxin-thioredoxin reductase catalytic subunit
MAFAQVGQHAVVKVVVIREAVKEYDGRSGTRLMGYPEVVPIMHNGLFVHMKAYGACASRRQLGDR